MGENIRALETDEEFSREKEKEKENLKYEFEFRCFVIHAAVDVSLNSTCSRTGRDVLSASRQRITGVSVLDTEEEMMIRCTIGRPSCSLEA